MTYRYSKGRRSAGVARNLDTGEQTFYVEAESSSSSNRARIELTHREARRLRDALTELLLANPHRPNSLSKFPQEFEHLPVVGSRIRTTKAWGGSGRWDYALATVTDVLVGGRVRAELDNDPGRKGTLHRGEYEVIG